MDVTGSAATNAIVTVNHKKVTRQGEYFWKELAVSNAASAVSQAVSVVGVKNFAVECRFATVIVAALLP